MICFTWNTYHGVSKLTQKCTLYFVLSYRKVGTMDSRLPSTPFLSCCRTTPPTCLLQLRLQMVLWLKKIGQLPTDFEPFYMFLFGGKGARYNKSKE
uniref:Uncharacterized protein n=1 Tax=Lepeophtheirus salmonis TaxID=72036 RepID=A0A0K2V678_LEPSM